MALAADYRYFTTSTLRQSEVPLSNAAPTPVNPALILDPNLVSTRKEERLLVKYQGTHPIGSRRRRAALQSSDNVPFEQMPYQCFQEARKVLAADRVEKLAQITEMRKRIANCQAKSAAEMGGEYVKKGKLVRMHKYLEELKILTDVNDPVIKKRFEDGMGMYHFMLTRLLLWRLTRAIPGDMNRPIYRYLADKKWRQYKRLLLMQRISQFHIVPDILPHLDPTAEVSLGFGRRNVQPGEFVDSRVSEIPARLNVQVFDKGERLVTIAAVDPDVPDEHEDAYTTRCHFLAVNIPISPTSTSVPLSKLKKDDHVIMPWLPPYAQKGAPYHRLAVFILQQEGEALDLETLKNKSNRRDGWKLRGLMNTKHLKPIGIHIFRSKWDEGTDGLVARHNIEGANVEYLRKKPEKAPYKKKDGSRYR